jgi:hypothetical protein
MAVYLHPHLVGTRRLLWTPLPETGEARTVFDFIKDDEVEVIE